MMAVLQTIDLKKYYGEGENQVKALDGICLEKMCIRDRIFARPS